MRYLQYKGVVEREYKMSLRKVMHQLCVNENLNAVDGAKKLGIAKEIFVYWRNYFRLEERQLLFDQTVVDLMHLQDRYTEAADRDYSDYGTAIPPSNTIDELEDVVDNLIGYYKHIHYSSEGFSLTTAKLPLYEFSKSLITDYRNGELAREMQSGR
ncbi:hypothetical protein [Planomicrobium okeanokoites]|uniref:hypothetical protein n=1 Tax=Planomicrobium okeanokoites TaxID=244 RepID=UPI0024933699|nr:hypothetical protein [Planomicrobium okeanokoites]